MALPVLADLKNYLRITTTTEDTALTAMLASATGLITAYLGRPITSVSRTYTVEDRRASALGVSRLSSDPLVASYIRVPDAPVNTSATFTITDAQGNLLDATTYRVDGDTGVVRAGSASTNTYPALVAGFGAFPYTIVATTGLAVRTDYSTVVEPCLFQAILDVAADLYQRRNPAATDESDGAGGMVRYGRSEETLPTRAIAMLEQFRRPPV